MGTVKGKRGGVVFRGLAEERGPVLDNAICREGHPCPAGRSGNALEGGQCMVPAAVSGESSTQEWSAASVLLVAKLLRRLARPLAGVTVDCNMEAEHHGCAEVKRS